MKLAYDQDQQVQPQAGSANPPNLFNFNELKTLFSKTKADIPIFYEDHTNDNVTAKFIYNEI
jgi:hypothetical protein